MDRRKFVQSVTGTAGIISLTGIPLISFATDPVPAMTIQDAINLVIAAVPTGPIPNTIDTVKSGNPAQPLTGIVTTMFATVEVIRQAAKAGANLVIAHEPVFYDHFDDTSKLQDNDTYKFKQALLDRHNIVVWRCHDYIHSFTNDGVYEGVLGKLGWKKYSDPEAPSRITLPGSPLKDIISLTKKSLGTGMLRYMGDPEARIRMVTLMVGAEGGSSQIRGINTTKPDLVMIGELVEWETMEYMRDLRASGAKTSLIIMGHIPSEEPGMEWLAGWLKPKTGGLPVRFIPSGPPVKWG
ncbi:MAG: NGG1p interacting factor NIF3 [Chitinophagaceae bacterium]|nr:MAG: NGG1p interacting factor NIF3 [Chitinophagaceae bacterium]